MRMEVRTILIIHLHHIWLLLEVSRRSILVYETGREEALLQQSLLGSFLSRVQRAVHHAPVGTLDHGSAPYQVLEDVDGGSGKTRRRIVEHELVDDDEV